MRNNPEPIYRETGSPDSAWSLWVTCRLFFMAVVVWFTLWAGYTFIVYLMKG